MKNQLRVGIVGCGYQGTILAQAISQIEELCVTACADPDTEAAAKVATATGHTNVYASVDKLLDNVDVDAVMIATSHHRLQETALTAIKAGKHVMAEKPIALNDQQAVEIEAAVEQAGVCYMSGYSFRFFAALKQVRDLIKAGAVGEIQAITGGIGTGPLSEGWKAQPETGGGALLYVGSHLIDEVLWFVEDDPVEVSANIRYRSDTKADETTSFQIRFSKWAVAQCFVTQASHAFFNYVDIVGRDGSVSLKGTGFGLYEILVSSNELSTFAQPTTIRPRLMGTITMMKHVPQLEEFVQAIHQQRQPSITVADGRRVLKLLDAINKSDQKKEPVRL